MTSKSPLATGRAIPSRQETEECLIEPTARIGPWLVESVLDRFGAVTVCRVRRNGRPPERIAIASQPARCEAIANSLKQRCPAFRFETGRTDTPGAAWITIPEPQGTSIASLLRQLGPVPEVVLQDWDRQLNDHCAALRAAGAHYGRLSLETLLVDTKNAISLRDEAVALAAQAAPPPDAASDSEQWQGVYAELLRARNRTPFPVEASVNHHSHDDADSNEADEVIEGDEEAPAATEEEEEAREVAATGVATAPLTKRTVRRSHRRRRSLIVAALATTAGCGLVYAFFSMRGPQSVAEAESHQRQPETLRSVLDNGDGRSPQPVEEAPLQRLESATIGGAPAGRTAIARPVAVELALPDDAIAAVDSVTSIEAASDPPAQPVAADAAPVPPLLGESETVRDAPSLQDAMTIQDEKPREEVPPAGPLAQGFDASANDPTLTIELPNETDAWSEWLPLAIKSEPSSTRVLMPNGKHALGRAVDATRYHITALNETTPILEFVVEAERSRCRWLVPPEKQAAFAAVCNGRFQLLDTNGGVLASVGLRKPKRLSQEPIDLASGSTARSLLLDYPPDRRSTLQITCVPPDGLRVLGDEQQKGAYRKSRFDYWIIADDPPTHGVLIRFDTAGSRTLDLEIQLYVQLDLQLRPMAWQRNAQQTWGDQLAWAIAQSETQLERVRGERDRAASYEHRGLLRRQEELLEARIERLQLLGRRLAESARMIAALNHAGAWRLTVETPFTDDTSQRLLAATLGAVANGAKPNAAAPHQDKDNE